MKVPFRWPALVGLALLAGCDADRPVPAATESAEPRIAPLPVAEPPLNREALIFAVARAASDWARGSTELERQRRLDGKRFELKLRFGCAADGPDSGSSSFDEQARVLRVRVKPEISLGTTLLEELELEGFEAAEGFWVHRPWLLEAGCPVRLPAERERTPVATPGNGSEAEQAPQLKIGIAQFYTEEDSRTLRRETRAYQATLKLDEDEAPSSRGYDLVLSGRLTKLRDGRVIACTGRADSPPSCVISARFDHVALVQPDGEVLAQWSGG